MITCQRMVWTLCCVGGWLLGLVVGWLVDWLAGFECDGRLSDYVRDKPLVEKGWGGGQRTCIWTLCRVGGWLVGWLVDWLTGFESDGRLNDYV